MCINVHVRHITAEVTCIAIAVISSVPSEVMEENPKVVRAMFSALSLAKLVQMQGTLMATSRVEDVALDSSTFAKV